MMLEDAQYTAYLTRIYFLLTGVKCSGAGKAHKEARTNEDDELVRIALTEWRVLKNENPPKSLTTGDNQLSIVGFNL